jgi:hypothetical protein
LYSTALGMNSISACVQCSAGTYSTLLGASACVQCLTGTYSTALGANADTQCTSCQAGTYSTAPASTVCALCGAGTYSTALGAMGSSACTPCQTAKYSTTAGADTASVCTQCLIQCPLPGQYSTCGNSSAGNCSVCANPITPLHYFVPSVTTVCPTAQAQPGYFRNCTTNPRAPMWISSPPAIYGGWCTFRGVVNNQPYYFCSKNQIHLWWQSTQWVGSSDFSLVGTSNFAISGPSADGSEPITALISVEVLDAGVNWVSLCPKGTYSAYEGSTSCTLAPIGGYVPSTGASNFIVCASGTRSLTPGASACTACSPGTYKPTSDTTDCIPAPIGGYVPSTGASNFIVCASGTQSPAPGASACTACSPGTYNPDTTGCIPAPLGKYVPNSGATASLQCASGTYSSTAGASACTACSTVCALGREIQGPCTLTSDTFCGLCSPVANCVFGGNGCGNSTNPNCVCLPGFEMVAGKCQQCMQGYFKAVNSSLPCAQWTSPSCAANYFRSNGTRFADTVCLQCPSPPGNAGIKGAQCEWGCNAGFNNTVIK